MSLSISLLDLGMAYRKTKVDLFYSPRLHNSEILKFENHLEENLLTLKEKIEKGQFPDCKKDSWTLVPKEIEPDKNDCDKKDSTVVYSDPLKQWTHLVKNSIKKPVAEFRVMEKLSIEFHIFATLWIQKVGHLFEGMLPDSACGNRLRRKNISNQNLLSDVDNHQMSRGDINLLSSGSLVPYLYPYRKWRDDGVRVMKDALEHETDIVTITADISGFYHNIDVEFMTKPEFHEVIGVELDEEQHLLNRLFIEALAIWGLSTPQKRGLPVGLIASTIIANVALFELDLVVKREIVPLYYGRYVDDVLIVIKNNSAFNKVDDVWDWIIKRSDGFLDWCGEGKKKSIKFCRPYLEKSEILFSNKKNKVFILSGPTGLTTVVTILRQIQERASEWRELPDIPDEAADIESGILSVLKTDGEDAESFHSTDKLSVRRAGFALKLRDIEAYARALPSKAWDKKRHSFFDAFTKHVLVLPVFFEFYTYLSRVIQLAVNCGDYSHLDKIILALETILEGFKSCELQVKAERDPAPPVDIDRQFRKELKTLITQSIEIGYPFGMKRVQVQELNEFLSHRHELYDAQSSNALRKKSKNLFERDLAYLPYRQTLLPKELTVLENSKVSKKSTLSYETAIKLLKPEIVTGVTEISKMKKTNQEIDLQLGFLFPTRPLSLNELYLIHPEPFGKNGQKEIAASILAMRGFAPEKLLPGIVEKNCIEIPYQNYQDKIRIAIANWKTDDSSWIASVMGEPDLSVRRYSRLNKLLNEVFRSQTRLDYLILPELSIPSRWFLPLAHKLQKKNISLIAGIEYLHNSKGRVRNQVWASLSYDGLGFPSMILYRQDKHKPALREEKQLKEYNNILLETKNIPSEYPPVLSHAGFYFSCLLCSELTNIAFRSSIRGKIDALFVPEWNKDTDGFISLVESAASDIHAYIIQCNNSQFGDSRIRAPYKESWRRDVIRIKGGVNDYFVIGEIDIKALRQFQSCYRSPEAPFKPVPDGYVISDNRKVLPEG